MALDEDTPSPPRVLLIGMMGAGKSTTGHLLAERLGWSYLDSDEEILRRTGRTVPEIWHADGEAAFRAEEAAVLAEATSSRTPTVVGVAGGAVLEPANRARITAAGLVVWLRVQVATLISRVGDGAGRPLLDGDPVEALTRLEAVRRPIYEALARAVVDVDGLAADEVVDRIVVELDRWAVRQHRPSGRAASGSAATPNGV